MPETTPLADGDRPTSRLPFSLIDEPAAPARREPLDAMRAAERQVDTDLAVDLRKGRQAVQRLTDFLDANLGYTLLA